MVLRYRVKVKKLETPQKYGNSPATGKSSQDAKYGSLRGEQSRGGLFTCIRLNSVMRAVRKRERRKIMARSFVYYGTGTFYWIEYDTSDTVPVCTLRLTLTA